MTFCSIVFLKLLFLFCGTVTEKQQTEEWLKWFYRDGFLFEICTVFFNLRCNRAAISRVASAWNWKNAKLCFKEGKILDFSI